jgi:hypothetical protein
MRARLHTLSRYLDRRHLQCRLMLVTARLPHTETIETRMLENSLNEGSSEACEPSVDPPTDQSAREVLHLAAFYNATPPS